MTAEEVWTGAQEALKEADCAYGEMHRIRQMFFEVTHIGMGTWGRQHPLDDRGKARVEALRRERARWMRQYKKLMGRIAWDAEARAYRLDGETC